MLMKNVTLGSTGIVVPQNCFGALPIQRVHDMDQAVKILRRAYDGGMRFFDTARAYSDSEKKLGTAFAGMRDKIYIATKTHAKDVEGFWKDLETSLELLGTDYIDIYQFHNAQQVYAPGDGTGMYEAMLEAKAQGKIRHIGVTTHSQKVCGDIIKSGLYETVQYPFSYLASEEDIALVKAAEAANMGFIGMKSLSGGLLTNAQVCFAFTSQFPNLAPIWGIQTEEELEQWLSFFDNAPEFTEDMKAIVEKDKKELAGSFCRSCNYCAPCTVGIQIFQCARMSQMVRRSRSEAWTNEYWRAEMAKIEDCVECGVCMTRCPYGLNIPQLLKANLADYKKILAGEINIGELG